MPEGVDTPSVPTPKGKGGLAEEIKRVPIWVWFVAAVVFFVVWKTYFSNGNTASAATQAASVPPASGGTATDGSGIDGSSAGIPVSVTGPDGGTGAGPCGPGTIWDPATGRCVGDANPPTHIPVDPRPPIIAPGPSGGVHQPAHPVVVAASQPPQRPAVDSVWGA